VTPPRRDPYQVLGVPPTADADAIKRAYRERALRDHPDRNPGDPAAEERFKAASEAYATLRDPDARRRYDAFVAAGGVVGQEARSASAPRPDFSTVDWRSVFQEADVPLDWSRYASAGTVPTTGHVVFDVLFRGVTRAFRQAGLLPGEDRAVPLRLDLATARVGGVRRVHVPGPIVCPDCRGQGPATNACASCGGAGVLRRGIEVDVRVPAGVRPGQRLRLQRMGGPGRPPGDAFVELDVVLPASVRRQGRDLLADAFLTPLEASRGTVLHVAGQAVRVAGGARDGQRLRVAGGGLGGGDLWLTLHEDILRGLARAVADGLVGLVNETAAAWRRLATAGRKA
jgi:molecular chaperone DnaJ